jgi:hypothetical protein
VNEIVARPDWTEGHALALLIKNSEPGIPNSGDPAGRHRRVIGYERAQNSTSLATARLVVTYAGQASSCECAIFLPIIQKK